jgi:hypothetical protein
LSRVLEKPSTAFTHLTAAYGSIGPITQLGRSNITNPGHVTNWGQLVFKYPGDVGRDPSPRLKLTRRRDRVYNDPRPSLQRSSAESLTCALSSTENGRGSPYHIFHRIPLLHISLLRLHPYSRFPHLPFQPMSKVDREFLSFDSKRHRTRSRPIPRPPPIRPLSPHVHSSLFPGA